MPAVGRSVPRKDAWDKVTGAARYIDDYSFPGMLFACTVRSPVPHGQLLGIDAKAALAMPGVVAVVSARDIPGTNVNPLVLPDQPFLAADTVRFHGEAVALVAADTPERAAAAAAAVKVEVEPLPGVFSIRESLDPKSPRLYRDDNAFSKYTIRRGDAAAAMARAPHVFKQEYETPYQEHAYLETQGMIAVPGFEDQMTVYGSMQCPFYVHDAVTAMLGVHRNRVRVVQTTTGGGFGGKEDVPSLLAAHAALLARRTGRPVKLVYKREEDIISMSKRHPALIRVEMGTDERGKILAARIEYYVDGGAYATLSPIVLWRGTVHALGPYVCDDVLVTSAAMATNLVPCGAYRGFGSPQVIFAAESMIDEIAHALRLDPVEIRRLNALTIGRQTITGQTIDQSCGLLETIDRATTSAGWLDKFQPPQDREAEGRVRRGIGISTIFYGVGLGAGGKHLARAGAMMAIQKDASVSIAVGNTEMGQGARTVLAQIGADALGCPYDLVFVIETDTAFVPDSGPTVASRTTFMSGNAIRAAAAELRGRLDALAAELLGKPGAPVAIVDGVARLKDGPAGGPTLAWADLVKQAYARRLMTSSFGWYVAPDTQFDAATGQGSAYFTYSYCTNVAEVEVDLDTGVLRVVRITAAHDMGKAINPQQVEGQIEGGTLQGVGYATLEEIKVDRGRLVNNAFATYILPTDRKSVV